MAASGSLSGPYRVDVEFDPPAKQSRLTVLFRGFMLIPHIIIMAVLGFVASIAIVLSWLAIVFTGKMPAGLAGFITGVLHWNTRVTAYQFLLTGVYPPFAMGPASYPGRLSIDPQLDGRSRITVLLRCFMLIPHMIVLGAIGFAAFFVFPIAWLVALFTGVVPAGMHTFLAGFIRWQTRYTAYAYLLVDDYPPFSMS
jgi:hypothetical protein